MYWAKATLESSSIATFINFRDSSKAGKVGQWSLDKQSVSNIFHLGAYHHYLPAWPLGLEEQAMELPLKICVRQDNIHRDMRFSNSAIFWDKIRIQNFTFSQSNLLLKKFPAFWFSAEFCVCFHNLLAIWHYFTRKTCTWSAHHEFTHGRQCVKLDMCITNILHLSSAINDWRRNMANSTCTSPRSKINLAYSITAGMCSWVSTCTSWAQIKWIDPNDISWKWRKGSVKNQFIKRKWALTTWMAASAMSLCPSSW